MPNLSSLSKAALLAGLTMLVGRVGDAAATTISQTDTFGIELGSSHTIEGTSDLSPPFQQFDPALGTLTGVTFALDSTISISNVTSGIASVVVNGFAVSSVGFTSLLGPSFSDDDVEPGVFGAKLTTAFYTGTSTFTVTLVQDITGVVPGAFGTFEWNGNSFVNETGLTLTYTYTPATPLPAALPLFATGLGGLGLLGWRRKRKARAI